MPRYRLSLNMTFDNISDVAALDQCVRNDAALLRLGADARTTLKGGNTVVELKVQRLLRDKPARKLWGETL